MAKVIFKQHTEPSQKKKIVDIHKWAKQRNKYFRRSVYLNCIQGFIILALLGKMYLCR